MWLATGTLLWGSVIWVPVRGQEIAAVVGAGTTRGVGARTGGGGARRNAAAAAFLWRLGCKIFRTEVIWSIVMFGWSASNLLTSPWSTKSPTVLANGRLIPSWGTAVEAGTGIDTSGMGKWMGECGFGDVCTRGG